MSFFHITFAKVLYIVPIIGTFSAYFLIKKRSLALILALLFLPPLFAEAGMILVSSYSNLTGRVILEVVAAYYPFAILGLGLWSPFIGLIGAYLTERIAQHDIILSGGMLFILGLGLGAAIGGGLLALYVTIANAINSPGEHSAFALWIVGGAAGGAIGGLILALFYRTSFPAESTSIRAPIT